MEGNFTRKMTKPNVMTVPYSVTMRGMSDQNWDTMDDMTLNGKKFWDGQPWAINKLWTMLTYESIYEIVAGARAGQTYLRDIVKGMNKPARWTTPIYGFPVIQRVPKVKEHRVRTVLGVLTLTDYLHGEVNKRKQLSGVAANFIHSIDSTVLLGVVDRLEGKLGVIHDCFLVHPNKGEEVRDAYKDSYVEVMKEDPLKLIASELDPKGKIEIPYINTLDLDEVYNSEYIIS